MTLGRDALPFTLLRFDQNEKMAIQWHPLLAQFLRHSLSDQIQIQDSISLGQMPLEMEVLAEMNLESLRGFDLDLPAILDLFPPEQVIENIGLEKTIEIIGLEKTIETIGWEKIIQNLDASTLNEQERELLIEQLRQLNENDN